MAIPMPTLLRRLLADVGDARISADPDVFISSITVDSRRVEPNALFACLHGTRVDGHDFAREAVARGAVAVLASRPVALPNNTPIVIVSDVLAALSPIAAALYDCPSTSLTCAGITGTNGKTTTTYFLEAITAAARRPFGLVGTLGARLAGKFTHNLRHTTPYAHELQKLLAQFRDNGASGAVLEVSSHALAMHRIDDVDFDVAVLTNITHDHLDFHGTFEAYRDAKRLLFERTAKGQRKPGGTSVLNLDDAEGARWAEQLPRALTYGIENPLAMLSASDLDFGPTSSAFYVRTLRPAPFEINLPGPFNVANAMAAITAACVLDIDVEAIAEGIAQVREVPGRMTTVPAGDVGIYVDYAHTPDSLRQALTSVRALASGRVICVFGCGGDRDPLKRPVMGRLARELADVAVITSDNPRFEDPQRIIDEIVEGAKGAGINSGDYSIEPDRAAAIEQAIASARSGDVVLIAGKGHEAYQLVRGEAIPFSDVDAAQAAVRKLQACRA